MTDDNEIEDIEEEEEPGVEVVTPHTVLPGRKGKKRRKKPIDILDEYKLSLKQELFCQYFTSPGEFFGNGFQSYCESYDYHPTTKQEYVVGRVRASQLLTNTKVLKRINDLLEDIGFNDTNVDKQLYFLIAQFSDLPSKLGAIKEYNKLKQRIVNKLEHSVTTPVTSFNILPPLTPEQIKEIKEKGSTTISTTDEEDEETEESNG